jgi:hypothetical protein
MTGLIHEYVHHFRPTLLRGSYELWLFPGETGGRKDAKTLTDQSPNGSKKRSLFITVRKFRRAAAAIWLQYKPRDHETVRRILGARRCDPPNRRSAPYLGARAG